MGENFHHCNQERSSKPGEICDLTPNMQGENLHWTWTRGVSLLFHLNAEIYARALEWLAMLGSLICLTFPGPLSDVCHIHHVLWQFDVIYSSSRVLYSLSCCTFCLSRNAHLLHSADSFLSPSLCTRATASAFSASPGKIALLFRKS